MKSSLFAAPRGHFSQRSSPGEEIPSQTCGKGTVATALDPTFKELTCLHRTNRDEFRRQMEVRGTVDEEQQQKKRADLQLSICQFRKYNL